MSQFPHDDFVKEYLPELIKDYGKVFSGKKIASQTKEIDVFFQPYKKVNNDVSQLGLLRKLLNTTCLFEVYRNSVITQQIIECIGKLADVTTSIARDNKKKNQKEEQVRLWIITPTLSQKILNGFEAQRQDNWEQGIYFLPDSLSTGVIVVHQLPVNEQTLWLRILGKGKVQEKAIEELNALSKDNPYRDSVLELVSNLFTMLQLNQEKRQQLTKEDTELIMKLSPIYTARLEEREKIGLEKGLQQGMEQGIQRGVEQGIQRGIQQEASLIIRLLKRKVGELSPDLETSVMGLPINILEDLGEALLDFNSLDDLTTWLEENNNSK